MRMLTLRPANADELARLEKQCFSVPWSRAMILEELRNPVSRYVGLEDDDGSMIAYGGIQIVEDEAYITNIATAPKHRRLGYAERILRLLLEFAAQGAVRRVSLEVRESNEAALNLYRKFGFLEEGRRKEYYHLPDEDALILNLYPESETLRP